MEAPGQSAALHPAQSKSVIIKSGVKPETVGGLPHLKTNNLGNICFCIKLMLKVGITLNPGCATQTETLTPTADTWGTAATRVASLHRRRPRTVTKL